MRDLLFGVGFIVVFGLVIVAPAAVLFTWWIIFLGNLIGLTT